MWGAKVVFVTAILAAFEAICTTFVKSGSCIFFIPLFMMRWMNLKNVYVWSGIGYDLSLLN
jgi:hypothetical protein